VGGAPDDDERRGAAGEAAAMPMEVEPKIAPVLDALLLDQLRRAAKWLPKDDPYLQAVAGSQRGAPEIDWTAAVQAISKSELTQGEFVARRGQGGAHPVQH